MLRFSVPSPGVSGTGPQSIQTAVVCLLLLAALLCAGPGGADTILIYYVSPSGIDSPMRNGRSPAAAWASIEYAINRSEVDAGDIIMVMGDSSPDNTDFEENVTVNKRVRIYGDDSAGAPPRVRAADPAQNVFTINSNGTEIKGLEIHGATGAAGILVNNASNCVLEHNRIGLSPIQTNQWGIAAGFSRKNVIRSNQISDNEFAGIYLDRSSANILDSNTVSYNGAAGIFVSGSAEDGSSANLLTGNHVSNSQTGIVLSARENVLSDNLVRSNVNGTVAGSRVALSRDSVWVHNVFEENDLGLLFSFAEPEKAVFLNDFYNGLDVAALSPGSRLGSPFPCVFELNATRHTGSLGNYYSDYSGSDSDGDEIGDTPFVSGNVRDDSPLTRSPLGYDVMAWSLGLFEGRSVLRKSDFSGQGEIMSLPIGGDRVFCTPDPSDREITFAGGTTDTNSTWGGWLTFAAPPSVVQTVNVNFGYSDALGNNFVAAGNSVSTPGDGTSHILTFAAEPSEFVLPQGKHLAVRVTNAGIKPIELMLGGAACVVKAPVGTTWPGPRLYFPHVDAGGDWQTEVAIINKSAAAANGTLTAYSANGTAIGALSLSLAGHARYAWPVGPSFASPESIRYLVLEGASEDVCGYTKFSIDGQYRAALPASSSPASDDLYVSHVASDPQWWTGIGLVNTSSLPKTLTFLASDGQSAAMALAAKGQAAFLVQDLFGGIIQPAIQSAVLKDSTGVVGLELFGSGNQLGGIRLSEQTASTLFYPHLHSDDQWWTGIVAYNPSGSASNLTITPYAADGTALAAQTLTVPGRSKYVGFAKDLGLPPTASWLQIHASRPVTGFELFGTWDGKILAGYTAVGLERTSGVFPKIDHEGWTGIALVNTTETAVSVTLTAYQDDGSALGTASIELAAHAKTVGYAEEIFAGHDISEAGYISYTASGKVAGFQLNGSTDGWLLDGLPGM